MIPRTIVSFHAHPDDEALLTGGTLARAAVEGHRVVLVVATSGEAGLAAGDPGADVLAQVRRDELAASAAVLGVARVVLLGHPDSGLGPGRRADDGPVPFSALDPQTVAEELAAVLTAEDADVLTTYDAAGGYGHPDHVQVHRVGLRAAELAGTPVVLEATVDRELLVRATRLLRLAAGVLPLPRLPELTTAFTFARGPDPSGGRPPPPRRQGQRPPRPREPGERGRRHPHRGAPAAPAAATASPRVGDRVVPRGGADTRRSPVGRHPGISQDGPCPPASVTRAARGRSAHSAVESSSSPSMATTRYCSSSRTSTVLPSGLVTSTS